MSGRSYNFGYPGGQHFGYYSQPGGFGPLFPHAYSTGYAQSYGPLYGTPQMFSGYNGGLGGGYSQGQLDAYYGYGYSPSQTANQYAGAYSRSSGYGNEGGLGNTAFDGWEY
jgi:hypothetical protein